MKGANQVPKILAEDSTGETTGYLNPAKGGQNIKVTGFSKVRYNNVYLGIDMVCYANPAKNGFKFDFIVHPNGNPDNIQLEYRRGHHMALLQRDCKRTGLYFGLEFNRWSLRKNRLSLPDLRTFQPLIPADGLRLFFQPGLRSFECKNR